MNRRVHTLYFSATGTTEKIVKGIAAGMAGNDDGEAAVGHNDFTLPEARTKIPSFGEGDLVVAGVPVYAGRVPNVLLKYLNSISGNGASAVAVVLYGNRDYDDALLELKDILESIGFHVIAAGAFIGEHSFSTTLAADRPDERDMAAVKDFAAKICDKMRMGDVKRDLVVKGNRPYREYHRVKDQAGKPASILKVAPKTNTDCIDCKLCVEICPMGSIDVDDVAQTTGICIKCCACVKKCPVGAKYFDDESYLWHKHELELKFTDPRREPECFV